MDIDQVVNAKDKIRIIKGTKYKTQNPKLNEVQIAKRSYTVVTRTISPANTSLVWWVGSGRYFCCASKRDITLVK